MGIKGLVSNRRRKDKSVKSEKYHRAMKKEKKKRLPPAALEIEDVHLFSKEKLKNKIKNPQNNIHISGKKKRRLTKRLGHTLKEKSQMDVEVENPKSKRGQTGEQDSDMADAEDALGGPSTSTSSSSQGKKNRRGGKKHRKKKTSTSTVDQEGGDGSEDVQMEEADDDL